MPAALSVTALCRSNRACSCGVCGAALGAGPVRLIWAMPLETSLPAVLVGRVIVIVGGSAADGRGRAANASMGVGPAERSTADPELDDVLCRAICR